MAEKIRILIVDDMEATRENLCKLLEFHPEIEVAGMADSGEAAIIQVRDQKPDVVLMDINMSGMDGITATEKITAVFPAVSVIIMSVQGEQEYLRRSLVAGAKDYLVKPFSGDELAQSIRQAFGEEQRRKKNGVEQLEPRGKVISLFSPKGGAGKTTLAVNLALELANQSGERVALLDADLPFGDVAMVLPLQPKRNVAELIRDIDRLNPAMLERHLTAYKGKLQVLTVPEKPEHSALINGRHLRHLVREMRSGFAYVVVDTESAFNDSMLALLDEADEILLLVPPGPPALKNTKLCLEMMAAMGYGREKIHLVFNRCPEDAGMMMRTVSRELTASLAAALPGDDERIRICAERQQPLVEAYPESPVSREIKTLTEWLLGRWQEKNDPPLRTGDELGRGCG